MFLTDLTEEQKNAFHNIAMDLIYSDEILDTNEAKLMTKLDSEMGLSKKETSKNKDQEKLLSAFETKKSKAIVILELLMLAYSDDDFNIDESNYIQNIANSLGVSSIDFTEMKWWARKKTDLDKEVLKFF
jgi:uncharacterized tellurite resistance protein B-like protein